MTTGVGPHGALPREVGGKSLEGTQGRLNLRMKARCKGGTTRDKKEFVGVPMTLWTTIYYILKGSKKRRSVG